ncbi:FCD domain-containing protein [Martelella radicis]|uniref:DNA-binding GntR family transcriptional regulator n=1 Tax=Martelella radicis TaxID=1397476 RepID=A0A7W6KKC8_9HYPH|nr:DNA-binding GntR family transcriptional regulator [Martelella radicis]
MVSSKLSNSGAAEPHGAKRLSDVAYERILEHLFAKKLPAGAFVSQNQLVEMLDIPVAPLRDALRVLEVEGVLTIHPRSGIEFVKPGLELTRSTYQYRTILECAAVKVFAETASDDEIAALLNEHETLSEKIGQTGLDADALAEIEHLEAALHDSIIGALDNPLINSSYKRMHHYLRLVRLDRKMTPPLAQRSLNEHMAILKACRARDVQAAEDAVRAHFDAALRRHMGLY